jgi:3-phenylpropionate/cinnamic acid dioxygenase small subunit
MFSDSERQAVIDFLHEEARLADEGRYAEWLALWTDDAVYWVPGSTDPGVVPRSTSRTSTTIADASRPA